MNSVLKVGAKLCTLLLCVSTFGNQAFAGNFIDSVSGGLSEKDVVVLQVEDPAPATAQRVNTVELNTSNSSLFEAMKTVKAMALKSNANLVKITEEHNNNITHAPDKIRAILYRTDNPESYEKEVTWNKSRRLSWNDFRGAIPADAGDITAAATYCGIGFETNVVSDNAKPKIFVYNTFYPSQSWVRPDEKNESVLIHEQGHFDLCELYTRKLRQKLDAVNINAHNMKNILQRVYNEVNAEYENRQEAYEEETQHGVDDAQEQKWTSVISKELSQTEKWAD